jgi:hypothetical protein
MNEVGSNESHLHRYSIKKIKRAMFDYTKKDSDPAICRRRFVHNDTTFGGIAAGGRVALVGECCRMKIRHIYFRGWYSKRMAS